ncbi:DUF1848 domain-containing protein [bacterium]|nr:DUF1848 domain-containing protein [bacterium]
MSSLISASRRTDIPHYFGAWFAARRREGFAEFRNAFGGRGIVSLRDGDVLGFLFWTKDARPFADQLRALRDDGVPYAFQYTITGCGRDLEPHIPSSVRAIDDFLAVRDGLPDSACIQWRYDPIVLSRARDVDFHLERFATIARALHGATRVVDISIIEPYRKAILRIADRTVRYRRVDPARHRWVSRNHPDLVQIGSEAGSLLEGLAAIASERGMELRSCSNPEWPLAPAQCCGLELFAPYGDALERAVAALPTAPSRGGCHCLRAVDIGMDNTCLGGCKYCYVVSSHELAVKNFRNHLPWRPMLR